MSLENLNAPQLEAVQNVSGPVLVLAGAGTGKTRVLTSRIINIVNLQLASPHQILAVTFTNKAAAEMKKRIGEVIGDQTHNLWVGTFHSIAAKILRRHPEAVGLRSDFTIIDDDDQTRLLKQILGDFNIDSKQFAPKAYLNKISRLKDKVIMPQAVESVGFEVSLPKLKEIYETYQFRLRSMNAADFGDLLSHNLQVFKSVPQVLAQYQDKFRYILVDEYQDTNNAQYQWLLHLAAIHRNICCVGDDDQSIYSWRGANIANILRFEKDFSGAKVIRLEQNYRSSARILAAADSVIANNKERHGKTLWTNAGAGEKVKVFSFPDDRAEAGTIARMIKNLGQAGKFKPSAIAVLVRAGYQTRAFEEAFIQNSLPYKVIGGAKFYERLEIRDAIAYLRICANPDDDLALNRIINVPKRGAGDAAISALYEKSKREKISFFAAVKKSLADQSFRGKARESLKTLIEQLEKAHSQIGKMALSELARSVLSDVGYIAMWKAENSLEAQGRLENIEEFISSLGDFSSMVEFLEYVSLIEAREDKNLQEAVSVMTVHAAKGLEFDLVFVPGLEDGLFPSGKSIDERNGLEEERRLMYVAITRARKELVLSSAKTRYVFGDYQAQMPSRFLKELPEAEIDFHAFSSMGERVEARGAREGVSGAMRGLSAKETALTAVFSENGHERQRIPGANALAARWGINKQIFHQKFGYGKILSVDGDKLTIAFDKSGVKIVMKGFVTEV